MTHFERLKTLSAEEFAKSIITGISSDPCDYCSYAKEYCNGFPCLYKTDSEIITEWLESEVEE